VDLRCLGEILDEGWHLKKGINDLITNPVIEDAYHSALRAGAYGGKLLGAGGGGFLLFVCPPEKQQNLQNSLAGLKPLAVKFSTEGARII
jgi:D-glycero-alpha-D-manno-heptose-7-phosphate kinase